MIKRLQLASGIFTRNSVWCRARHRQNVPASLPGNGQFRRNIGRMSVSREGILKRYWLESNSAFQKEFDGIRKLVTTDTKVRNKDPIPGEVFFENRNFLMKIRFKDGESREVNIAWLRDACPCENCIDKSTTQKRFQTTDIPAYIAIRDAIIQEDDSLKVTWKRDIPHYKDEHVSMYPKEFWASLPATVEDSRHYRKYPATMLANPWNKDELKLLRMSNEKFMGEDRSLWQALICLVTDGVIMIENVPSNESSVELIAKRIGNLRDSLYGRTWDVKSIPDAKNVAYTSTYLGLHMDLLYMRDPPGLQLLHCLKNTCEGGTALFSDSFKAARSLDPKYFTVLANHKTSYHYVNNNENYYYEHPTFECNPAGPRVFQNLEYINWSPPFQAPYNFAAGEPQHTSFVDLFKASRRFADAVEKKENIFRHDYKEGDCVIFNNRRILHGRESFSAEGGERWLRGAYVDTDVFHSRLRVLDSQFSKDD